MRCSLVCAAPCAWPHDRESYGDGGPCSSSIGHVLEELTQRGGSIEDLFQGRISVRSTVDGRIQAIVNEALENGLARYESRHPRSKGLVQGSVVVLANADAAVLAEVGGRQVYGDRDANYDDQFKGPIPMRQALAESRNAAAVWITQEIGVSTVLQTANEMGIRTPLRPYLSTALGASEVRLLELANAYRAIASGVLAEPHVIDRVSDLSGNPMYEPAGSVRAIQSAALRSIQEGRRGVVRLPYGTAHSLAGRDFPAPVMGKTGTTSGFRDALFVGSTYGTDGITVAVRIGFDDNRPLGNRETGGRTALPVFREIMLRVYLEELVGRAPRFPREIEDGINQYLAMLETLPEPPPEALVGANVPPAETEVPALTAAAAGRPSGGHGPE